MDIIDVLVAKALTPQGKIETYAAKAQQAVREASNAVTTAEAAAQSAEETAAAASQTLSQLQGVVDDITGAAQTEIDKLALQLVQTKNSDVVDNALKIVYPSGNQESIQHITKYYTTTGQNEDGTMTQKAITDALRTSGGGGSYIGEEYKGHVVIVGEDGNIISSNTLTEANVIEALINSGTYNSDLVAGVKIDYKNYTVTPMSEYNYNNFYMYGGRERCAVDNNGQIVAFLGNNSHQLYPGYQIMVYQPKFYYLRTILKTSTVESGKAIEEEALLLSDTLQPGFKIHPLFLNELGEEVDYVLLSAFQGSIESNSGESYVERKYQNFGEQKLASVGGAKPITGVNNAFNVITAEQLAKNRGTHWHITNLRYESAMQMLEIVEFQSLNGQNSLEEGIGRIESSMTYNYCGITGSTVGDTTGPAASTTFTIGNNTITYSDPGYRAISYRGVENPWGNAWRFVAGVNIVGDGSSNGGRVYVCKNYNYDVDSNSNYDYVGFTLPAVGGWISGFGYGNDKLDWTYIPASIENGNSIYPVGDNLWVTTNLNTTHCLACGGSWAYGVNNGPFYYACDRTPNEYTSRCNARLMYIPSSSDTYYSANIRKWEMTPRGKK